MGVCWLCLFSCFINAFRNVVRGWCSRSFPQDTTHGWIAVQHSHPLSGRARMRVSDHHFLIELVMFYLFNIMPSWAKVVRGDVRHWGRRNFLGIMSPWMTFRIHWRSCTSSREKDRGTLFPKEKGCFPGAVGIYPSQRSLLWWVPWGDLPTPASLLLLLCHWGNH